MIATLLKHEAIRTRGLLLVIAGLAAGLSVIGALMALTGWPLLAQLGLVLGFVGACGLVPALQLGQAVDYYRSGYGRVGYFTQTLPIRGSRIYWAKLLWAVVVLILGLVATLALVLLVLLAGADLLGISRASLLPTMGEAIADAFAVAPALAVAAPVVVVLLYGLNTAMLFCAVSVGSEQWMHRLGWGGPVVVWVALYAVSQIAMFALILAVPFGLAADASGGLGLERVDLLGAMLSGVEPEIVPIGWLPALLLSIPVLVWWTARSWDRKVSLP